MGRADYAPSTSPQPGGRVESVAEGSPAARGGIRAGDTVLAVDGERLRDVIDWRWLTDGDLLSVQLVRDSGHLEEVEVARDPGESWGVEFASPVFDRVRTCANDCTFCFVAQLPDGLRETLYVRDDDYRLSFLQGNFISLTNLTDADVERIREQRLSPLYVSLHAVDADVRRELVCARADRALQRFDELLDSGIDLHVQVVLVPGVNDGDVLEQTLTWLAEREGVESVGIVPLGFTRHQTRFATSFNDPDAAAAVIRQVLPWQFAMMERDGRAWVMLGDEFYLNARAPIPTAEWYDGYVQFENGIGLVRDFVDSATDLRVALEEAVRALPEDEESVTVVTGTMAATTIAGALQAVGAAGRVRLLAVPNRFFGGNVAVTGLLTGADAIEAVAHDAASGIYLIPDVIVNTDGITLDGLTLAEMMQRSGADLRLVSSDAAGLLAGIEGAARPRSQKE